MNSTVSFWKGRPLTDLTQAELIEAVETLGKQVAAFYTDEAIEMRALGRVEQIRHENRAATSGRHWWQFRS